MAFPLHRRDAGDAYPHQVRSAASVIAIVCALISFYFSSKGREFVALFLALAAVGSGLLGFVKAASPRVSGGILSLAAIALGAIAVVVALIALIV